MNRILYIVVLLAYVFLQSSFGEEHAERSKTVRIVCAERFPDVYVHDGKIEGIQAEFVRSAVERAGFVADLKLLPIKRCYKLVREGEVDAMFPVRYESFLAEFMQFCPEPNKAELKEYGKEGWRERYRIMTVDMVVVTHSDVTNRRDEYKGDISALPAPIRMVYGTSFIEDMEASGKRIELVKRDIQNFRKLIRDKRGSVIAPSFVAEELYGSRTFAGKLYIHDKSFTSNPKYLAFSKDSGKLDEDEKRKIWESLRRTAQDHVERNIAFARTTQVAEDFLFLRGLGGD